MMKKEPIEQLFERLDKKLDIASPSPDHRKNFLAKLESRTLKPVTIGTRKKNIKWIQPLFIAASAVLVAGLLFSQLNFFSAPGDLADVSPEMQETQDFFTNAIERELFDIKESMTPENQILVLDAIEQLKLLEEDYNLLKNDLSESGKDKRVIYAMIDNFQNRINLLQDVVEQMDALKKLTEIEEAVTL